MHAGRPRAGVQQGLAPPDRRPEGRGAVQLGDQGPAEGREDPGQAHPPEGEKGRQDQKRPGRDREEDREAPPKGDRVLPGVRRDDRRRQQDLQGLLGTESRAPRHPRGGGLHRVPTIRGLGAAGQLRRAPGAELPRPDLAEDDAGVPEEAPHEAGAHGLGLRASRRPRPERGEEAEQVPVQPPVHDRRHGPPAVVGGVLAVQELGLRFQAALPGAAARGVQLEQERPRLRREQARRAKGVLECRDPNRPPPPRVRAPPVERAEAGDPKLKHEAHPHAADLRWAANLLRARPGGDEQREP
mmetsp:Transcript_8515/g.20919  ORF Transcript_8515/g.20919 Transcript_8515/m.20919 type:complete len:299 (-) Transcript_8515:420-1316(-)